MRRQRRGARFAVIAKGGAAARERLDLDFGEIGKIADAGQRRLAARDIARRAPCATLATACWKSPRAKAA